MGPYINILHIYIYIHILLDKMIADCRKFEAAE